MSGCPGFGGTLRHDQVKTGELVATDKTQPEPSAACVESREASRSGSEEVASAGDPGGLTTPAAAKQQPASNSEKKSMFAPPPVQPTQPAEHGIWFDFNAGCRVTLPENGGPWRVRLSDLDTGNVIFEAEITSGRVKSTKHYFVRFRIEVWSAGKLVMQHDYSARGKDVLVQFPVGTLGDTLGWLPYAVKFQQDHGCRLTCAMAKRLIPLFEEAYPEIAFVPQEDIQPEGFYATYIMGLFFDDDARVFQPCDFRLVGLHRTAAYILGVDPAEARPKLVLADETRPISEPYACIAVQSTTMAKYWNNPDGWREIIRFLKEAGYRVICIDKQPVHGHGLVWVHIPHGAEDKTGLPLAEVARWLKHAEFFVGLSSGLAWLAWAVGTKVVMISGFSHPVSEFETPYRVINYHTCNSCWNDVRVRFDHKDFLWCPRHKDTPRQFECTRLITPDQVKQVLRRIPGFRDKQSTDRHTAHFCHAITGRGYGCQ
jgi:autotransporter strand-loop-strand O-heptosyltransferase